VDAPCPYWTPTVIWVRRPVFSSQDTEQRSPTASGSFAICTMEGGALKRLVKASGSEGGYLISKLPFAGTWHRAPRRPYVERYTRPRTDLKTTIDHDSVTSDTLGKWHLTFPSFRACEIQPKPGQHARDLAPSTLRAEQTLGSASKRASRQGSQEVTGDSQREHRRYSICSTTSSKSRS